MKIFIFIFLMLFPLMPALAQDMTQDMGQEGEPTQEAMEEIGVSADIRGFVWGLPRALILENEEAEPFGEFEGKEVFRGSQYGVNAYITYIFIEDKLARAKLEFIPRVGTPQVQFGDYMDIRDTYVEEYGDFAEENLRWRNTKYQSTPDQWGMAIMQGHLSIETIWETPTTTVRMTYKGERFKASHDVDYISKTVLIPEEQPQFVPSTLETP